MLERQTAASRSKWYDYALAVLLPLLFTLGWLHGNLQLPSSDATDYLRAALQTYQHHQSLPFWRRIFDWDLLRGFRPIFFPYFSLPFLTLSNGNIMFSYQSVVIASVCFSGIYVYALLRLVLEKIPAIVASNFIILLPFVLNLPFTYFAEAGVLPLTFASIYHLIRSNFFQNTFQTVIFICVMGLTITVRPVEALTNFIFIFGFFLLQGKQRHLFSWLQISAVMSCILTSVFLFSLFSLLHFTDHYPLQVINPFYDRQFAKLLTHLIYATMFLSIGSWALTFFQYHSQANNLHSRPPLIRVMALLCILSMLWFLPYAFQTFMWVYRTSIGDLAAQSLTGRHVSIFNALFAHVKAEGTLLVVVSVMLALVALPTFSKTQLKKIFSNVLFIYLFLLIPFVIWEVLETVQSMSRKLSVAMPAFIMLCFIIALQRTRGFHLRLGIVIVLLGIQFNNAITFIYPNVTPRILAAYMGSYVLPMTFRPNPHDVIMQFVAQEARVKNIKHVGILVDVETAKPADPFLLGFLSLSQKTSYTLGFATLSQFDEEHINRFYQSFDTLLIADKVENMQNPAAAANYTQQYQQAYNLNYKIWFHALQLIADNKIANYGFELDKCIIVVAIDQQPYKTCLFVRSKYQG